MGIPGANRPLYRLMVFTMVLAVSGCASYVATSGRVVLKDDHATVDVAFTNDDRSVIENYYKNSKKKGLPPGLAKRGGKLPPGLSKRDRLPPGLQGDTLPYRLETKLSPLPSSYIRVRVGHDIVLMDRSTRVVFDVLYGIAD